MVENGFQRNVAPAARLAGVASSTYPGIAAGRPGKAAREVAAGRPGEPS